MRRALDQAGIDLVWKGPDGDVEIRAIKNPLQPGKDGVQLNPGLNTPCTLDALAEDIATAEGAAGKLPGQDELLKEPSAGLVYRISRREWVPGQPIVRYHIPNVVALPAS